MGVLTNEDLVKALGINLANWNWEVSNGKFVINENEGRALAEFIKEKSNE